jgi:tetratricopeptide (TPR) repeat protein
MLLEAAGVWSLESGDLIRAEEYFAQAEDALGPAPELSDRLNMLGNLAELSAMQGAFEDACDYYTRAREALRPQDPWRLRQLVYGGLGYCALELGDLRLARDCESRLEYDGEGYFDPWVIVLFRVTLMRRRGETERGVQYLESLARVFEGRMRLVVIKLRLFELRLCRNSNTNARCLSQWLLQETERLGLEIRRKETLALCPC